MQTEFLLDLLRRYIGYGWVFAGVHGLVLLLVLWSFIDFWRETVGLKRWNPAVTDGPKGPRRQCIGVLTEFCLENEKAAPAGLLVPLTDFTDRIDSIVEGMVGRLHDLTNLFLVVGIAGTIWSFFRVVVQAPTGGTPNRDILIEGISTAFPVAFVGLVLYTLSYLVAYMPERSLRSAAASATERAWQERRKLLRSQAAALEEAMAPVRDLKETLTGAIEPVFAYLRDSVATTHRSATDHLEAVGTAVARINDAVGGVAQSVRLLNDSATKVDGLLAGMPAVLGQLHDLQLQHSQAVASLGVTTGRVESEFQQTQQIWGAILESLRSLIQEFERLPPQIGASTRASLDTVARQVPAVFVKGSEELHEKLTGIARELQASVGGSSRSLSTAAASLRDVAEQSEVIFSRSVDLALDRVTATASQKLPVLEAVFGRMFPNVLGRFEQLTQHNNALADRLQVLHDAYQKLAERLADASHKDDRTLEIQRLNQTSSAMLESVRSIARATAAATDLLARIERKVPASGRVWFPFDNAWGRIRRIIFGR